MLLIKTFITFVLTVIYNTQKGECKMKIRNLSLFGIVPILMFLFLFTAMPILDSNGGMTAQTVIDFNSAISASTNMGYSQIISHHDVDVFSKTLCPTNIPNDYWVRFNSPNSYIVMGQTTEATSIGLDGYLSIGNSNSHATRDINIYYRVDTNFTNNDPFVSQTLSSQTCCHYNLITTGTVPAGMYIKITRQAGNVNDAVFIDNIRVNGALPVELTSFSAMDKFKYIQLNWRTETELNNYGFHIEQTTDQDEKNWTEIGFVEGKGISATPQKYEYRDGNPSFTAGRIYYRLKQVDRDGSYEYSDVVSVNRTEAVTNSVISYPSPFSNTLRVNLNVEQEQDITIDIYSLNGNRIKTLYNGNISGNISLTFNTNSLPTGAYFVMVRNGEKILMKTMALKSHY